MAERAAEYSDQDGREFVFIMVGATPHCYERKKGGLYRRPNWDPYPKKTQTTLLRIVGWLQMENNCPSICPPEGSFRFYTPGSCGGPCPQFAS
jgi:hypothetical protein